MTTDVINRAFRARMDAEARSDLILAGTVLIVCAAFAGPAFNAGEEHVSIADMLVLVTTLSGITVPVCVAYLSLGRALDIFSEIGDATRFFMNRRNLKDSDLRYTRMLVTQSPVESGSGFADDLKALEEIALLGSASGSHLTFHSKLRLVPEGLRTKFCKHFMESHQHDALPLVAACVGLLALTCCLILFAGHFGMDSFPFFVMEHAAIVTTFLGNIIAYAYLLDIALARASIQRATLRKSEELCAGVGKLADERAAAERRSATDTLIEAKNEANELEKTPKAATLRGMMARATQAMAKNRPVRRPNRKRKT